ncbi:MAG: hypothetical protein LBV27_06250 [Oscillospiraceae bacterium]|jgi:hypothetical protein|nr:hypothetical protein [Oscillospiraceae bacterium]
MEIGGVIAPGWSFGDGAVNEHAAGVSAGAARHNENRRFSLRADLIRGYRVRKG